MNKLTTAIRALLGTTPEQPRHDWRLHAFGGGGVINMPHCTRQEAIDAGNKSGAVQYVDDDNRFIFYKPAGFNGQASAVGFDKPAK